ncbi:ATP-grasp domain-containing protein, partial [Salmonella enterica subsp. enterica serovar Kentucky]|nr:ATP-grasp domain-containing protein [Salmonella enterica subsp. enterica serovar Kentucky]
ILSVAAACTLFALIGCNNRAEVDALQPAQAAELKPMQQSWRGGEVSLVGARAHDGSTVFYPLTHNLHQDGILRTSVAFPQANAE